MFNKLIFISLLAATSFLHADIKEITQLDDIRPYIVKNGLYLFDIDDTLIDNPFSLGAPPWRAWVKPKLPKDATPFVLFDGLSLYIAKHASYKPVEPTTPALIEDLQKGGNAAFAFTARGRSQWYTTDIPGVDEFTEEQLRGAGIDFSKTEVPPELQALEAAYFYNGIIFAQHIKKGDLLKHLFKDLNYQPDLIVFVDDKLDQVQSVEAALKGSGIPFMGFWYRRSEVDRANFNPMVANVQLEHLLTSGEIVPDDKALELSKSIQESPEAYLKQILNSVNLEMLTPQIETLQLIR